MSLRHCDQKLPLDDYGLLPKYAVWPVDPFDSHGGGRLSLRIVKPLRPAGLWNFVDTAAGRSCGPVNAPDLRDRRIRDRLRNGQQC